MRRRLTFNERWELGLFLAIAAVLCTVLAGAMQLRRVPVMTATETVSQPTSTLSQWRADSDIAALPQPTLDLQAPPLSLAELLPPPKPAASLAKVAAKPPASDIRTYGGKAYRLVKVLHLRVTAYAADPRCTYPYDGKTTASGLASTTNGGKLVAADTSLISMHSLVSVPGYAGNGTVPVLDRGGAIKGYRLDVMMPTFEAAQKWGSRMLDVKIYSPAK
jgi:3D (Asp-Asp-Asp) domain-containing protein